MLLSKATLQQIDAAGVKKPDATLLALPEKVLQFGTGVFLRGLFDYFVDKANRAGAFNGRVVVVKSTASGGTDAFETQDGLFTHFIKGIENGVKTEETVINSAISRVVSARDQWSDILALAQSKDLQVVVSNTTEVGLTLQADDKIANTPPSSFPGKLLAFLYERYKAFGGSQDSGLVIIPTELIPNNGIVLRDICLQLADSNGLDEAFKTWLVSANDFCSSLVDRIVPGKLPKAEAEQAAADFGYQDDLMIMSEAYSLWAIETTSDRTKDILSFATANDGIVLSPNIEKYRELKLRLLNGGHTFSCGLAVLKGFTTVKEAMADAAFGDFIKTLMYDEIAKVVANDDTITLDEARRFADQVLDRFRNPFIEHQWLAITMQYTSKLRMRCVPVLQAYYERFDAVPEYMAKGVAAYLLFMRSEKNAEGQYIGKAAGKEYLITDDRAADLHDAWKGKTTTEAVEAILSNDGLWGFNLTLLPDFVGAVTDALESLDAKTNPSLQESSI